MRFTCKRDGENKTAPQRQHVPCVKVTFWTLLPCTSLLLLSLTCLWALLPHQDLIPIPYSPDLCPDWLCSFVVTALSLFLSGLFHWLFSFSSVQPTETFSIFLIHSYRLLPGWGLWSSTGKKAESDHIPSQRISLILEQERKKHF